jgi:hypothetical protein
MIILDLNLFRIVKFLIVLVNNYIILFHLIGLSSLNMALASSPSKINQHNLLNSEEIEQRALNYDRYQDLE